MIIIGHKLVEFEPFVLVKHADEIAKYDNLLFNFNAKFIEFAKKFGKTFSVKTSKVDEILIANASGAKFIIVDKKNAKAMQELATNYLFDAKIALVISSQRSLKELAEFGVDAAIFKDAIQNFSPSVFSNLTNIKPNISKFQNLNLLNRLKDNNLLLKFKKENKNSKSIFDNLD